MTNELLVQSVRNVGCKRGYPYRAYGVYRPEPRQRDGRLTYRLVRSGAWFRSDVAGRRAFPGIQVRPGIRHGSPA